MKIQMLVTAIVLACGSAFAADAPPAAGPAVGHTMTAGAEMRADKAARKTKKKLAKKHQRQAHHAAAQHQRNMEHASGMPMHQGGMHAMGAGTGAPARATDATTVERQARMDSAYSDWLRTQKR